MNLDDCLSDLIDLTRDSLECNGQVALAEILTVLREVAELRGLSYKRAHRESAAAHKEATLATRFELSP